MNIELMRVQFAETVTRMGDLARPPAGSADDWEMTDEAAAEFDRLELEAARMERQIADTERRLATVARMEQERRTTTEAGSDTNSDIGAPYNINRGGDPFDLNSIRADATTQDLRARIETGLEKDRSTDPKVAEAAVATLAQVHGDKRSLAMRYLATGSANYRSAFAKLMIGRRDLWTDRERQAVQRAQAIGSDPAGGFAVPFSLDPTVVLTNDSATNPIRQLARIVQITTDSWNGVTSAGATAHWRAEAEQADDDSITLAQPNIPVHRMDLFIPYSVEIEGDWAGLQQDLRLVMQDARDQLEATAHAKGSGSGQPTGIETALAGGASIVLPTTAETFAAGDVYEVQRLLPPRYRANAQWLMNLGTSHLIRQFDNAGGGDFWTSLGGGTPERLLGMPANIASEVDDAADLDPAVTATNHVLYVGDWSRYVIVDRVGMTIELISHLFGTANNRPTGQRGLYSWLRTGAATVDDNAFRVLSIPTTA